jgi:polysaccharide deacetylase 2 family uncharacterized protein YibQ
MRKTAQKKSTATKTPRKRKNSGSLNRMDALKAFITACAVVVISLLISITIIVFHKNNVKHKVNEDPDVEIVNNEINDVESVKTPSETHPAPLYALPPAVQTPVTHSSETHKAPLASKSAPVSEKPVASSKPAPVVPAAGTSSHNTAKPIEEKGVLVFVIDDAGNNLHELEPFLRIPGPLTIAVLPGLPHSAEAARRIRTAGKEVILHQPMEALGGQNPGPGAIYSNMGADEIRAVLRRNIEEVGPVKGINNHQGSMITMNGNIMKIILAFCAENNLFFLDSRTTADTAVPVLAKQMGMKIAERDVFIDNEQNKDAMREFITSGLARAQKNGKAVMIGHTWSSELAPLLAEQFPLLRNRGFTIKTVSDIINEK